MMPNPEIENRRRGGSFVHSHLETSSRQPNFIRGGLRASKTLLPQLKIKNNVGNFSDYKCLVK